MEVIKDMEIGTLVREAEQDPMWQMFPGETGEIIASADNEMEMPGCGRFWTVLFGTVSMSFIDVHLVRVDASR